MKSFKAKISKEELNELPIEVFKGKIHIIDTEEQATEAVEYLKQQDFIGFDTETRPTFIKGESHTVALMQLSNETDCFLFRLNTIGFTDAINQLFCEEKLLKIGLSTKDDFRALSHIKDNFNYKNFIELQSYVTQFGIEEKSLSKIYAIIFGKRIAKGQRLTNWEAEPLTEKQQKYAALDAYATRRIYKELEKHKTKGYPIKAKARKVVSIIKNFVNKSNKINTNNQ